MNEEVFPIDLDNRKKEAIEAFERHVSSGKVAFFQQVGINFVIGRREGPYLYDLSGQNRVIDCHCNGGVFNLGHRNPAVIDSLNKALQALDIGNHHLVSEQRATLAKRLAELSPGGQLDYTVFGVGGGEAIDLAIKVARGYTKRNIIISAIGGYHGHTGVALAAGDSRYYEPFGLAASDFIQVPFNDLTRLKQVLSGDTAAVLFETIPATSGMPVPDQDYFIQARELCDNNGTLMIIDEVQSGLGRTGKLWAVEHFEVVPDIMVIGKGLSGGIYPISATCFKPKLESVFHQDPFIHVSTFGGAELGCRVALKVLEISANPLFLTQVQKTAEIFASGFQSLTLRYKNLLVGLRQKGLMMGIAMREKHYGPLFTRAAYDNGLLSVYANNDTSVAQLLPPLTTDEDLAHDILERIDSAFTLMQALIKN
jgi:acetylornithine/succinyldiaminopimelate/putrescine aminotransferase